MEFRNTRMEDLPSIMHIVNQAKIHMKEAGINQWQNGYPNEQVFIDDINRNESYVMTDHGKVVGTVAITFHDKKNDIRIKDGKWINNNMAYAVIQRVAVDDKYKGQGIAGILLKQVEVLKSEEIASARIVTHEDNLAMQRTIHKAGFELCGITHINDGSERLSYEKMI